MWSNIKIFTAILHSCCLSGRRDGNTSGPEERGRVAGSSKEEGAGGLGSQKTDLGLESSVVKGRKAWRSGLMFSQKRGAKGGTSPSWTTGNQGADS